MGFNKLILPEVQNLKRTIAKRGQRRIYSILGKKAC